MRKFFNKYSNVVTFFWFIAILWTTIWSIKLVYNHVDCDFLPNYYATLCCTLFIGFLFGWAFGVIRELHRREDER